MREWQRQRRARFAVPDRQEGRAVLPPARQGQELATVTNIGDRPHVADLIGTIKVMLDAYTEGKLDRLFIVHNKFVNTMTQKPAIHQLLPVVTEDEDKLKKRGTTSTSHPRRSCSMAC